MDDLEVVTATEGGPSESEMSAADMERHAEVRCARLMVELERHHPDWYELYEDTSPDTASRADVVELMYSAPTDFALGLLYGKFTMRVEIASITGREFS